MTPEISTYIDEEGREFHYSFIDNKADKLVVHFTAFFGDWGDRKEYKKYYKGYFHRYRMFADEKKYNFLFVCDQYGATQNGTYYTGRAGDFFVERATEAIIDGVVRKMGVSWGTDVVTIGSSMGATGALKFGLLKGAKGIVAIAPHIDLDVCAKLQGREQHVAWICPDGDTQAVSNHQYTRQIGKLVQEMPVPTSRIFIHSCEDDYGVHSEQVIPFIEAYKNKGGELDLFFKATGGHSGDACGKLVLTDVIERIFLSKAIDVKQYEKFKYWPESQKSLRNIFRKMIH